MNYLYNGVELPALPEWDRVAYPYAIMVWGGTGGNRLSHCLLWAFSNPHHLTHYNSIQNKYSIWISEDEKCLYSQAKYNSKDGIYEPFPAMVEYPNETYPYNENGLTSKPDWANYDVLDNKGTLYLAASDPIPILAPALDPLSLFMGWKAGNWVARQRGKKKPATGVYDDNMPIEWKTQNVANNPKIPFEVYQIYSYNGLEFGRPDIEADSDYKYHLIEKYSSGYHYWCLKQPFVYVNEDKEYAKIEGGYNYSLYICRTGEAGFVHHDDISGDNLKLNWENIIWTNTDICDADGTVRMAATEPVYIREQWGSFATKISNYIPTPEIFEKSALSISYSGEEFILPYMYGDNSSTGCTIALFMDVTTYTSFVIFAIEKEDNEVVPGEPGLYFLMDESIPSDVTFKFFVPDET